MELKGVLEEWKTVPEGLEIEQTFDQNAGSGEEDGSPLNRGASKRSSYRRHLSYRS